MASSAAGTHPRPEVENGPPAKQLKLNVDSPGPDGGDVTSHREAETASSLESDVTPMVVKWAPDSDSTLMNIEGATVANGNGLHVATGEDFVGRLTVEKLGSLPSDCGAGATGVQRTKTSLCSYFRKKGCRHGASCRYAHGEEELKQRPDGTWDPTSERAKSLLPKSATAVEVLSPEAAPGIDGKQQAIADTLSKCILHVPKSWSVDQFKKFLTENDIKYSNAKKRKGWNIAFVGCRTPEDVDHATKVLDGKNVNDKELKVVESRPRSWEQKNAASLPDVTEGAERISDADLDGNLSDCDVGDVELAAISREGGAGLKRHVCDAVTPRAHMTYEDQLSLKRDSISQVLKRLVRNTRKGIPGGNPLPDWISSAKDKGGLPCALEGVLASPVVDGYRNKCEFTIGLSDNGERVVGFQVGSFREGVLAVAEPTDCRNVSVIAKSYASIFQEFVRQSELPVWDKKTNSGFWRLLIVREGRSSRVGEVLSPITEVMLMVQVCSTRIDEERRNVEFTKIVNHLSLAANSSSLPLTALLVQDHVGISNVAASNAPLHTLVIPRQEHRDEGSSGYIHDHIGNLRFRISPTAFFQVNTLAAERLYSLAGEWAGLTPDTLLFDVCCGTGTIGLTLAHRVGLVVGIEMNESAVADAKKNAEINDITNCRFVCSKAEDVMDSLLKEYLALEESDTAGNDGKADTMKGEEHGVETETKIANDEKEIKGRQQWRRKFKNIVAIVDPPRVGLHPVVLKTLRLHSELHRLVYISCNPLSLLANTVELCTPLSTETSSAKGKSWRGGLKGIGNVGLARRRVQKMPPSEPFKPVKAIAVDLFPHTVHCEMVMLLER